MGVIGNYEATRAINPLSDSVGVGAIVAPPGVQPSSSSGFTLFDQLIEQLQLPTIGIYTPWGGREGMDWMEVRQPPDTNIVVAGLNDQTWTAAQTLSMGASLPWIGVLADRTPSTQELVQAAVGTPYEFFQTQAVYAQEDASEPPTIRFLHWFRLRDPGDENGGSTGPSAIATAVNGQLVFAAQVNYSTSAQRVPPQMPFSEALAAQFPGQATPEPGAEPVPGGSSPYVPPAAPPVAAWKPYVVPIAATALAFAVGGYFAARHVKKRRRAR
jgi:hypothetical protein